MIEPVEVHFIRAEIRNTYWEQAVALCAALGIFAITAWEGGFLLIGQIPLQAACIWVFASARTRRGTLRKHLTFAERLSTP